MNIMQVGQRWRYTDTKYCFVVEIINEQGLANIVQVIKNITGGYRIDEHIYASLAASLQDKQNPNIYRGGSEPNYAWTYEYLVGQDKT